LKHSEHISFISQFISAGASGEDEDCPICKDFDQIYLMNGLINERNKEVRIDLSSFRSTEVPLYTSQQSRIHTPRYLCFFHNVHLSKPTSKKFVKNQKNQEDNTSGDI